MKSICLTENQTSFVSKTDLNVRQVARLVRLIRAGCTVEPTTRINDSTGGFEIRIDGRIGVIGLGEDTQVVIEPKVPMHNILAILQWTRKTNLQATGTDPTARNSGPFVMQWLRIFIAEASTVIGEGLRRDYVQRIRRSMPIRGRIDVRRTMRKPGPVAPICRFSEFTIDNPHNQLLLAATRSAQSAPGLPFDIRKELVHIENTLFSSVTFLRPRDALILRPKYSSANQHYVLLHSMCRMILNSRVAGLNDGAELTRGILLLTDNLFEEAVFRILKYHLKGEYLVHWEETKRFSPDLRIWPMKFDITIRNPDGKLVAVLDCKYKQKAHHSDTYQVVAYARAIDVRRAALVYPEPLSLMHAGKFGDKEGISINSLVFNVRSPLEDSTTEFVQSVKNWLNS